MHKTIKKRKIALVAIVTTMFFAAYAHHRFGSKPTGTGHLSDRELDEISGIAASAVNPDIFYVHNDSGDSSRFFAIDAQGNLKETFRFKGNEAGPLGVTDCEDVAVGPGPVKNKSYIYLGDIGDNNSSRKHLTVYRFAEPKVENGKTTATIAASKLFVKYPDGAHDAETLMADPSDKLLYIVTKREDSVGVYSTPLVFKDGDTVTLKKNCRLHFQGFKLLKWITAGDISADGSQILLKSYSKVYYWKRTPGIPVWKTMQNKPAELNYEQEKQGEAIGFTRDGKYYYTTSEGVYAPIYRYSISN
ncbi:hypothetical protein MUY27_06290 [Mucilaginibacter sp. RS28]|uniref:Uncharacterized protein n=1 Tax=Mucilaginibacter straminoryzae TaxID=2932774 RepID=A0A9X2B935_9SPHI|nr:hypothetical protein [Mucilaginibacter straminoryzae]MCJ8209310.1 hypothetical protein [Mucilaginibacter straminoryzae]